MQLIKTKKDNWFCWYFIIFLLLIRWQSSLDATSSLDRTKHRWDDWNDSHKETHPHRWRYGLQYYDDENINEKREGSKNRRGIQWQRRFEDILRICYEEYIFWFHFHGHWDADYEWVRMYLKHSIIWGTQSSLANSYYLSDGLWKKSTRSSLGRSRWAYCKTNS